MGRILALDVAFSNTGWAILEYSDNEWKCLDAYVITTKPEHKKKKLRVADDDVRRSTELFATLSAIMVQANIKGVVAELPTGGAQGARPNRAMGMATSVAACLVEQFKVPAEYINPNDSKKTVTGNKNASKKQVQDAIIKKYPTCTKSFKLKRGSQTEYENKFEHAADALAAFECAKEGVLVRLLQN